MKLLVSSFAVTLTALFSLWMGSGKSESSSTSDIPQLLEKHNDIGSASEMSSILEAYDQAVIELNKNPKDIDARLDLARVFMLEARLTGEHGHYYPAALEQAELAADLAQNDDQRYEGLYLQAGVLLSQHHFERALEVANEALQINNHHAGLYGTLVDAHTELGNYQEAVAYCDQMMALRPDLRAYSRVSYLRELHGDLPGAIQAMEAAVEAGYPGNEDRAWAAVELAKLYVKQHGYESAKICYEKILEERPAYPFAIGGLAQLELENGNYDRAESLYNKAAALIPEVSFYEGLCRVYMETDRIEEGEALYKQILEMYQEDIATGHHMNLDLAEMVFELGNDRAWARKLLKEELAYRPNNKSVLELWKRVEEV